MDALAGMGIFGVLLVIFWVVAGLFLPFFVWGIYNKTDKTAAELRQIKQLLQDGLDVYPVRKGEER